jgi:hypothetical protein
VKVLRVFPRRTKATPIDELAFVGEPWLFLPEADEVHVSCTFTWDCNEARRLAKAWSRHYPIVKLGGPAFGDRGGEFEPGMYLRPGYVITSRGCPNRCFGCFVPQREGAIRLLTVRDGFIVQDNNLLACPKSHIHAVLDMLSRQSQRPIFSGGLEAALFTREMALAILSVRPERLFFAYDRSGDYRHIEEAVAIIRELAEWKRGTMRHHVSCYILVGYPGDDVGQAQERIAKVMSLDVRAYPMFYRDDVFTRRPVEWMDLIGGTIAMGGRA